MPPSGEQGKALRRPWPCARRGPRRVRPRRRRPKPAERNLRRGLRSADRLLGREGRDDDARVRSFDLDRVNALLREHVHGKEDYGLQPGCPRILMLSKLDAEAARA